MKKTNVVEMIMPDRRLSRDEIGQRGVAIYDSKLRTILEPQFHGQFVAIDVETVGEVLSPVPCSVVPPKHTSWTARNSRATFTPSMKIVWPICNLNSIPL